MEEREYFYTKHYIHRWTSGPTEFTLDPDNHMLPIESLERAKELAEAEKVSASDDSHCNTTYGYKVEYETDNPYPWQEKS